MPACSKFLRITVISKRTLTKDVEIGYIELDLDELERRDEWIKLKLLGDAANNSADPGSSGMEATAPQNGHPSIRTNVNVMNHYVLPNRDYSNDIVPIYSGNIPMVCKQILALNIANRDELARTAVNVYIGLGKEYDLFSKLVQTEICSTEDLNIIFRGNSVATKAIDYYMKIVGMGYLNVTLGDLVKQVYKSKEICEVMS